MTDRRTGAAESDIGDDEDAQLLWQATARAEALLDALAAGRPATPELSALLGYLREAVLARITEQGQQVFPALRQADPSHPGIERLHEGHLLLREDIEDLAAAAIVHLSQDPDQLAAVTRALIIRLEEHLRNEAAALARLPGEYQAGASEWARAEHWYPLTEGPLINLDQLRSDEADDAVLNRLTHLRPGEHVELHGHCDLQRLWRRLQRRAPGDYSRSDRRDDTDGQIVTVTRRPTD